MDPKVSVIIPTYNDGDHLSRAIDSALSQTMEAIEIIIIDDASTDATKSVVDKYDDSRLLYVKHSQNKGGSAARNTGLKHASGEYVAFLDADDEWREPKLEQQVELLDSRDPEYVAAYCDAHVKISPLLDKSRSFYKRITDSHGITGVEGGEELVDELLLLNFSIGTSSTLMVTREVAEKINGFDESFDRQQDLEFLIRILQEGKLAFVPSKHVVKYETGKPSAETIEQSRYHFLEKYSDRVFQLEAKGKSAIDNHRIHIANAYLTEGKFRNAISLLLNRSIWDRQQFPRLVWYSAKGTWEKFH